MWVLSVASLLLRPTLSPTGVALRRARPLACASLPNLAGLRREADRQLSRAYKKTQKATSRAAACHRDQEALLADDNASLEALEALPDCVALQASAEEESARLARCARAP